MPSAVAKKFGENSFEPFIQKRLFHFIFRFCIDYDGYVWNVRNFAKNLISWKKLINIPSNGFVFWH